MPNECFGQGRKQPIIRSHCVTESGDADNTRQGKRLAV
jgi:hypothetical protein